MRFKLPGFLFALAGATIVNAAPENIGSRLELFVDKHLIESLDNVRLELAKPRAEEISFHFDESWEGPTSGAYVTVLRDGDKLRMYYRGRQDGPDGKAIQVACLAESKDGITWTKPNLGLHEFKGSKANNIVFPVDPHVIAHNFCPFIDTRPGVPANERYKAVGGGYPRGLARLVSADGVHWREFRPEPIFAEYALDSMNVPAWLPEEKVYAVYLRTLIGDPKPKDTKRSGSVVREVSRSVSKDFITWSKPEVMKREGQKEHLYTNATQPYFRAPHILIALPLRFVPNRKVLSASEMDAFGVGATQRTAIGDAVFMTSRGGNQYDRTFMESFIRPGLDRKTWSARNNYPALGVVQTSPMEMSMYVSGHYTLPDNHIRRYSLRLDGFASVRAPYAGGAIVTKPIVFSGGKLLLNYSTSAAGSVKVELQDQAGKPLPGFAAADCDELIGDEIARTLSWKGKPGLQKFAGQPVKIRFVMKDADLYSYQFQP